MTKGAKKKGTISRSLAKQIAQSACDLKADNIEVLDLKRLSSLSDYFVIASGRSDRQVQAISDRIQEDLSKMGRKPLGVEGFQQGQWVLLDYGEVIAHIFYEEVREFYSLDKLWSEAPRIRFRLR